MFAEKKYDIAIVGGGLAGVSLALLLSDHLPSIHVVLLEAFSLTDSDKLQQAPSYDDRSSALSLGSCQILQTIVAKSNSLWPALEPHLSPIKQVHVSDRGHPAGALMNRSNKKPDEVSTHDVLGYVVENRNLGQVLLQQLTQLTNVTLMSPAVVERISIDSEFAQLHLKDSSQSPLNAELVVIADGAESALREQLGITVQRRPYHQAAVIANITTSSFHNDVAYERFTDSGPMALLPLQDFNGEHRCALVWTIDEDSVDAINQMSDEIFLQKIQQRFGNRLGFFTKAGKRHVYPLVLHKAQEQIRSHVVLMGNAAHAMHPVAGQGFNLSLRDCLALAETLQTAVKNNESIGSISVLQRYIDQQSWDQEKTINASHLLTLLFSTSETAAAFARNTGLFGLNFLPGIKTWFARHAMGLSGTGKAGKAGKAGR